MTDRTRRAFLSFSTGALASMTGCLGDRTVPWPGDSTSRNETETPPQSTGNPDHLSFNHATPIHRVDAEFPQRDVGPYYLALLTTEDHAAAFPTDHFENAEADAFVTDTNYDHDAVIVFHDRESSSTPDLTLTGTLREGDTIMIDATYPGQAATSDITTDTLLVRVTTGDAPLRGARAMLHPQYGDSIRLGTANLYTQSTFEQPGDLMIHNHDCTPTSLSVTVTYEGDLFAQHRIELGPATSRRLDEVFTHAGNWIVTVDHNNTTITQSWSFTDTAPGDVLLDVDGSGDVSLEHRPSGVDSVSYVCETTEFPYESSNPNENLDTPVDLWVVDQSEDAHTLTVTIHDGDTMVFSDEFELQSGYDKARRAGLLAKKTAYTVDVTLDGTTSVSESVTVQERMSKLTIRVTEAGELTVTDDSS